MLIVIYICVHIVEVHILVFTIIDIIWYMCRGLSLCFFLMVAVGIAPFCCGSGVWQRVSPSQQTNILCMRTREKIAVSSLCFPE